jgi:hypothetical protein
MSRRLPPLASLRRFAQPRAARERCELCSVELGPDHAHLVEPASRRLLCACDACSILFSARESVKYRRVPRRVERLADFRLSDEQWAGLSLPVGLAFFLHSSAAGRPLAVYPSPAGPTEATLPAEDWEALAEDNPVLRALEPDVEALLVNRVGAAREHYRVGVDECYKLVGLLRAHWRGLSGGDAVWVEIGNFFADLANRCGPQEVPRA